MKLRKILFATDCSPASETALQVETSLAHDSGAKLLLLHVSNLEAAPVGELFDEEPQPPETEWRRLEGLSKQVGDVPCECRWMHREPHREAEGIVATARREHADMVVVGTHGRTGLMHLLTGSVAEEVVREAPCPVLAVRRRKSSAA